MDLSLSAPLLASTFGLIFVAELPDKTALASIVLATRLPARQVLLGACLAFLIQTVIAVTAGGLLQLLPAEPVRVAAGLGFFAFAILAFRRHSPLDMGDKEREAERKHPRPPWLASFLVVFVAEWGDLTQLATATLVARTGQPLSVAVGAIGGLWAVAGIAAYTGAQAGRFLNPTLLKWASSGLLAIVGAVVLGSAFANG